MNIRRLTYAPRWLLNKWGKLKSRIMPFTPMGQGQDLLDSEYSGAVWDYLRDLTETPRFGIVWSFCRRLAPTGSILEIGCGDALLHEFVNPALYSHYTGVDISEVAIAKTASIKLPNTEFIAADAETFTPSRSYDLIVFNEVLEYFNDPAAVVRRYEAFAAEGGYFVVSMFAGIDTSRTRHIWRALGKRYEQVAQATVSTQFEYRWVIKAFRSKPKA